MKLGAGACSGMGASSVFYGTMVLHFTSLKVEVSPEFVSKAIRTVGPCKHKVGCTQGNSADHLPLYM